jgi:hypothetical protein
VQGACKKYSQHWNYWQELDISSLSRKTTKELGSFELLKWWKGFTKRIPFVQGRTQGALNPQIKFAQQRKRIRGKSRMRYFN